ncbi:CDGSH iron-sulfur domain-containing protein [Candidatus Bipolaricaulota bacterium]
MRSRIYSFEADGIVVHWDYHRCIHVEACIRALPDVFERNKRPWITPACGSVDDVAAACEACPTGALHYERRDTGLPEATPKKNEITVSSDGPLYVKGDVRVTDASGETILKDTRVALCRCGHTRNKPLCDGSHEKAEFKARGALTEAHVAASDAGAPEGGKLTISAGDPGPLTIKGSAEIRGEGSRNCSHVHVGALCCCGKSKNRPFCDGSHVED